MQSTWYIVISILLVLINSVVRLLFPSRYVPAAQTQSGFLKGPIFARVLATLAEISFYFLEASCFVIPLHGPFAFLVLLGEVFCWLHVLLQSEGLGWCEDVLWTMLQLYVLYFVTRNKRLCFFICVPFVIYMMVVHLPRMLKRVNSPYINAWTGSQVIPDMDEDTRTWTITSLIFQPIVCAVFILAILFRARM